MDGTRRNWLMAAVAAAALNTGAYAETPRFDFDLRPQPLKYALRAVEMFEQQFPRETDPMPQEQHGYHDIAGREPKTARATQMIFDGGFWIAAFDLA